MDSIYNFLEQSSMYVVLIITLLIWIGLFSYIFKIDKKISKLEKELND